MGTFENEKLVNLVEKPKGVTKAYAAIGLYLYSPKVFEHIKDVKPSYRGELEITSVNSIMLDTGKLSYSFLDNWWTDAGTMETYLLANRLVNNE